jgi:hypothetical protein
VAEQRFLEASTSSRRNFLLLVLSLGLGGFVLAQFGEPALYVHLKSLPPCEQVQWLRGLLLGAALLTLLLALLTLAYLRSLHRAGQFPITNRWLLRRTPISRGRSLLVLKWLLALVVVCLLGMTALLTSALLTGRLPRIPPGCEVLATRPTSTQDLVNTEPATTSLTRLHAIAV